MTTSQLQQLWLASFFSPPIDRPCQVFWISEEKSPPAHASTLSSELPPQTGGGDSGKVVCEQVKPVSWVGELRAGWRRAEGELQTGRAKAMQSEGLYNAEWSVRGIDPD